MSVEIQLAAYGFRIPREVENAYKRKYKEIILNTPLVDTFALYRSIDITAEIDINYSISLSSVFTFTIRIYAEEYMCYHIIPNKLISRFIYSRSFVNTTNKLTEAFKAHMQDLYPILNFSNLRLDLSNVIIVNQPPAGGAYDFFRLG